MQSSDRAPLLSACLVLSTLLAGCHTPYGYQYPYGYYGQPQYPTSPVYSIPPGSPGGIYTPGMSPPGMGTPMPASPGTTPTYDPNGPINWQTPTQPSQPTQPPPNSAPVFNTNPTNAPAGGTSGGRVPDYPDDGPSASKPVLQPTSATRDTESNPFPDSGANIPPVQVGSPPEELFEPPIQGTSGVQETSSLMKANLEVPEEISRFGRDSAHANPQWLRGEIDYDNRTRTWHIIYSETPNPRDPNGGSLTLANHPDLAGCRSGDVVLVEGAIDSSVPDGRGKPIYRLDKVTRLAQ